MSNLSIISWNVNGLQGILKKDENGQKVGKRVSNALSLLLDKEDPTIICLQEIKCSDKFSHSPYFPRHPYRYVNHCTCKKAYAGTLVASKIKPLHVWNNFNYLGENIVDSGLTSEGRLITLEFDTFFLINVYSPNSGVYGMKRLQWRIDVWERMMRKYICALGRTEKEIILIGDLNVIHTNLDSSYANPNVAGASVSERGAFSQLLDLGLGDSYRLLHPTQKEYTWTWEHGRKGYRLDYALVTAGIDVTSSEILTYHGSDHFPIRLDI